MFDKQAPIGKKHQISSKIRKFRCLRKMVRFIRFAECVELSSLMGDDCRVYPEMQNLTIK